MSNKNPEPLIYENEDEDEDEDELQGTNRIPAEPEGASRIFQTPPARLYKLGTGF